MKTKNFFAAMCGVFLLAGAVLATYTAVTKSQKEMSDLTKQNLEALVQSTKEGNDDNVLRLKKVECRCTNGKVGFTLKCYVDGDLEKCTPTQQGSKSCYKVNILQQNVELC